MQLSIIILNYNVRHFLELCLNSVQKAIQNIDAEIIIVDNASIDESCVMIRKTFPNIRLIENNVNVGFPKGNNIGVSAAKGDYICILNPDTIVAEDTFEKLLAFAQTKTNLGIVGCEMIDGSGRFLPESKRGIPTPWVSFTKIFGLYKIFPNTILFNQYYAQHLPKNQTGKVAILTGAIMLLKRNLYIEIGGFDENCFMYSDDIDLSYTILQKGKDNYYCPQTTIIHFKGESTTKNKLYLKRFQEAMIFFHRKHFNGSIFFVFFMKIGIVLFTLFKIFQSKNTPKIKPEKHIILTKNIALKSKLEKCFNHLISFPFEEINYNQNHPKKTEFIFDNQTISYKKTIDFMKNNASQKTSFKFLSSSATFIIGSNSSNDKGTVIKL